MDNSQLSEGNFMSNPERGKDFETQNEFPSELDQKPQKTLETIDAMVSRNSTISEEKSKVPLEMPPGEDAGIPTTESDKANLRIRGYGDNGKFGNGNYDDMKRIIVAASEDPHNLNDAIQELSEEISGLGKVA